MNRTILRHNLNVGRILSAVDIGSNTAHLLVGDVDGASIRKIADDTEWLGLGEIVGRTGEIPSYLQDQIIRILVAFRQTSRQAKADGWYVFGTEALRRASNGKALLKRIRADIGVDLELVTSLREAELGARGSLIDAGSKTPTLLTDVGGGSAQLSEIVDQTLSHASSVPLGTGALMARLNLTCPCSDETVSHLREVILTSLATIPTTFVPERMVAAGGVARGLWRAVHPDGEREIHLKELEYIMWAAQRLNHVHTMNRFRVKAKRATTLLPGAVVFYSIMQQFGMESMTVSRFGVREGAILEMAEGKIMPCPL